MIFSWVSILQNQYVIVKPFGFVSQILPFCNLQYDVCSIKKTPNILGVFLNVLAIIFNWLVLFLEILYSWIPFIEISKL